jgi:hypothetical protein
MTDQTTQALVEYDKLLIVTSELMEFWLDNEEPPAWLVNEYYDQLSKVQVAMNPDKLFEKIGKATADYYEKIQEKLGSRLDKTPDLF